MLFHCRSNFPEVRMIELFVEIIDPVASFGEPLVEEALRPNDSDNEPNIHRGDSDDNIDHVLTHHAGASSSGTQQYPPHLLNMNLEALSDPG
ncbi:hypothetical protein PIB30_078963 [Stylosanthes scabra]|uniref:Uncharacterized protein n=1 Tax=Stylosanthes scabra TaxID=79078 RepID=A0ABU6QRM5_9FABA|nr:hypothetical protein [Stylosanthes scabra]